MSIKKKALRSYIVQSNGNASGLMMLIALPLMLCFSALAAMSIAKTFMSPDFVEAFLPFLNAIDWYVPTAVVGSVFFIAAIIPLIVKPEEQKKEKDDELTYAEAELDLKYINNVVKPIFILDVKNLVDHKDMADRLSGMLIDALSYGKIEPRAHLDAKLRGRQRRTELDKDIIVLKNLTRIWKYALNDVQLAGISLESDKPFEGVQRIGDGIGVKPMIDAYMSGVPMDDILA